MEVRTEDLKGHFPAWAVAWMARRSEQFQAATSGKGKPMMYGTGKSRDSD